MTEKPDSDIIIIGGGIGGSAATLRAVQNGMQASWITGSKQSRIRSRSQWVKHLDNMIGFHEDVIKDQVVTALERHKLSDAADFIGGQHYHINNRMIIKNTVKRLRANYAGWITFIDADATGLSAHDGSFTVTAAGQHYAAPAVVLATGIMDEQPQFKVRDKHGQPLTTPRPIYPFANYESALYCIRCEGHLTRNDSVAVIGRSQSAAQVAFMFHERYGNRVFLLGNGQAPDLSSELEQVCQAYGIVIIPDLITDFISADVGELCGVVFDGHPDIKVRFATIMMGTHRAYNDLARQVGAKLVDENKAPETSQIIIDHRGQTSVRGLFAVGDIAWREDEPMMKQVYTAQEYAVRAVDSIDSRRRTVMRKKRVNSLT